MYNLYLWIEQLSGNTRDIKQDRFYIRSEYTYAVYIMSAISLTYRRIEDIDELILRKSKTRKGELSEAYFPRYVQVWLTRLNAIDVSNFVYQTMKRYKENNYVNSFFINSEELEINLAFVDYYQCLKTILNLDDKKYCFPSYMIVDKNKIEPFISRYIFGNNWTKEFKIDLANSLILLDRYDVSKAYMSNWTYGWEDDKIEAFIIEHRTI